MARRRLDIARSYGTVHGVTENGARFFQDGHYFSNSGRYVCSEAGVKEPLDDGKEEPAEEQALPQDPAPAAVDTSSPEGRREALMQLTIGSLTKMVKEAGGEPITGQGAKARAIEWLIANVPA